MSLLNFNAPKKIKIDRGFDGGPDGGYMPQMSDDDAARWKAKILNEGKCNARIELRKSFPNTATQVMIFVALDGWDFANKNESIDQKQEQYGHTQATRGLNVRMSMNGPLKLTFEQFDEFAQIIAEAKAYLKK